MAEIKNWLELPLFFLIIFAKTNIIRQLVSASKYSSIGTSESRNQTTAENGNVKTSINGNLRKSSGVREATSGPSHCEVHCASPYSAEIRQFVMLGTEDFYRLAVYDGLFVDKSDFIREITEDSHRVIMITWPRRWGKTMNMDMLKRFLEIQIDGSGVPKSGGHTFNRRLFLGGKVKILDGGAKKLKRLRIADNVDTLDQHQGRYPVIFVTFKNVVGNTYRQIEDKMKELVGGLFRQYSYAGLSLKDQREKAKFELYHSGGDVIKSGEMLEDGLQYLCKLLHDYHKKKVYILMDDFETPLSEIYCQPSKFIENERKGSSYEEECAQTSELFRNIFDQCLSGRNRYLEKAVLTGLRRSPKIDLFSELPEFVEYNASSHKKEKFCKFYGFSETEINGLLKEVSLSEELTSSFGEKYFCDAKQKEPIYNPWEVMLNILKRKSNLNYMYEK